MTGPEHYDLAEHCLADATQADPNADRDDVMMLLRFAEVHAMLALAAAQTLPVIVQMMGDNTQVTEWARATGVWDAIQQENGRLAEERPRQSPTEVDPNAEGCVDHEPTALPGCVDCARRQGLVR